MSSAKEHCVFMSSEIHCSIFVEEHCLQQGLQQGFTSACTNHKGCSSVLALFRTQHTWE